MKRSSIFALGAALILLLTFAPTVSATDYGPASVITTVAVGHEPNYDLNGSGPNVTLPTPLNLASLAGMTIFGVCVSLALWGLLSLGKTGGRNHRGGT